MKRVIERQTKNERVAKGERNTYYIHRGTERERE